jgi:hypothetical protein
MKQAIALFCLFTLLTASCDRMKKKTKETVNKSGEAAGKAATEFIEGISEGVYKTLECEISLSRELQDKGIKKGKFSIEDDKSGGNNNVLVIYLVFEKDIQDTLAAKVTDKNGVEIGRTKSVIDGKAGEAGYIDFIFDKRSYIESRSKILIE